MDKIIKDFLKSVSFGKDVANDCYGGVNSFYKQDKNRVNAFNRYIKDILPRLPDITEQELEEAFKNTFSARLELKGNYIKYTAGQFYNIEVPQAMAWALDYIQRQRGVYGKYDLSAISKHN